MGYMRHHAIVVTGHERFYHDSTLPTIGQAHEAAIRFGCESVTSVSLSSTNGYASFMVAPDGSKEAGKRRLRATKRATRSPCGFGAWARGIRGPKSSMGTTKAPRALCATRTSLAPHEEGLSPLRSLARPTALIANARARLSAHPVLAMPDDQRCG